jgi:hypothetical protein
MGRKLPTARPKPDKETMLVIDAGGDYVTFYRVEAVYNEQTGKLRVGHVLAESAATMPRERALEQITKML